ncbi:NAD(P)H-dependent flavin oxidoreductase [Pseudomonas syringae group genomosp. 3]|uniref:NAD(P)H-dependent flavin oxidoreductase n=1 Tax=Pseudomonas syringae group genomosp. 3 TaxID=251701 RepID=UPI000EFE6637|nr:nitronate monooxygenase family protein [Pseudomonas syringae group genomosp. 3]QQN29817.1 nitronate monooxygenase [Pseudomonas syringae pv. maculicola]RMO82973.1 Oxidoreductase, 2-nitropropane dioxygenase family [Pseudomonas syringae pv. maculicola]
MSQWPDTRILELFDIELPVLQAPMAGASSSPMAIAVAKAGGLASLPCALLTLDQINEQVTVFRQHAGSAPLNLNFFCHTPPEYNADRAERWKQALKPYYEELGADFDAPTPVSNRAPFDSATCALVERLKPEVVSFHFGLPEQALLERVRATGAKIISSATTVEEAVWLEQHGCDAVIAMGYEAGGHRGLFLSDQLHTQVGTFALVPQIADAVKIPVIAAGGIADGRGVAAAFVLGASAVQVGTAYLFCPQASVSALHRQALLDATDSQTALTNLFTGRPARGIVNRIMREAGPISALAPAFPLVGGALMPLRAIAEKQHSSDFTSLWAGQAVGIKHQLDATELTRQLAENALKILSPL